MWPDLRGVGTRGGWGGEICWAWWFMHSGAVSSVGSSWMLAMVMLSSLLADAVPMICKHHSLGRELVKSLCAMSTALSPEVHLARAT